MAPEVITPNATYDQGADWWSLGCVIYQFLTGHSPFRGSGGKKLSKEEVDRRTLEADVKYPDYISADAKDLIKQLLDRDPKNRLGLLEVGVRVGCDEEGANSGLEFLKHTHRLPRQGCFRDQVAPVVCRH